ncbi:hypothetical protein ACJMK2_000223 [Sinanodonta woodiana]|uniref:Trs120/TRAPPC9 N-terminal domain-containing protein n=1 Tax=Sinanodonta woodiana TaxID=1069815 RepID=A0ABD3XQD7_SINWO
MNIIDYHQTAEDHQSLLILVHQIGTQISTKEFHATWERIQRSQCINVPGQRRTVWVRYKRYYPLDCNEWGEFQAHRKALGLISVGKCSTQTQFESLFETYKKDKEEYASTLYNSRLIVLGMNADGSPLSDSESEIFRKSSIVQDNENATHLANDNMSIVQDIVDLEGNVVLEENETKETVIRPHSNSFSKESTGSEVIFFPAISKSADMDEKLKEFITSIFFVLDGKRLDRSFERADKMQLLCAPFEKKDYIGVDTDAKSYKKKCQGRLRKHLADFCLQAGLPGEAMLHYNTALDILKPVNDWLWMGGSIKHSYANGLQDLPESVVRTSLEQDDIIEKYKEALMYYSKVRNSVVV